MQRNEGHTFDTTATKWSIYAFHLSQHRWWEFLETPVLIPPNPLFRIKIRTIVGERSSASEKFVLFCKPFYFICYYYVLGQFHWLSCQHEWSARIYGLDSFDVFFTRNDFNAVLACQCIIVRTHRCCCGVHGSRICMFEIFMWKKHSAQDSILTEVLCEKSWWHDGNKWFWKTKLVNEIWQKKTKMFFAYLRNRSPFKCGNRKHVDSLQMVCAK